MEKVVYSKCSLERKSEYKIITSIIEKDGKRVVRKRAANEQAYQHVNSMYQNYQNNTNYLEESVLFAPCAQIEDGVVEFEYIQGKNLSQIIEQHIEEEQWEEVLNDVEILKNIIYGVKRIEKFQTSDTFQKIFGNVKGLEQYQAACGMDIDILADNIIFSEEKKYVIDYEWIFPFSIPLKYIMFRTIFFNGVINSLEDELKQQIWKIAEIDEQEREIFYQMELSFQKHVAGLSFDELYKKMGMKAHFLDEQGLKNSINHIELKNNKGDLVYSCLSGNKENKISIDVEDSEWVEIQPCEDSCIIKILSATTETMEQLVPVESNEVLNILDDYYFGERALIRYDLTGKKKFEFQYSILEKGDGFILQLAEALKKNHELTLENIDLKQREGVYEKHSKELELEVLSLGDKKGKLERELLSLGDEKGKLERKLLSLGDEKGELERELLSLGNQKWEYEQKNTLLEQDKEQLQQEVNALENEKGKLEEELEAIKAGKGWKAFAVLNGLKNE